jgi:hypothetical protein
MTIGIDTSVLLAYYQAKAGVPVTGAAATGTAAKQVAPTAPWSTNPTPADESAAVRSALAGTPYINENAAKLDLPGASTDYKKLFALYQGLSTMDDVAAQAQTKGLSSINLTSLQKAFASGLTQVNTYLSTLKLDELRLTQGAVSTTTKPTLGVPATKAAYVTGPITNSTSTEPDAFQGSVQFDISIKSIGVTHNVNIDLSDMGSTPRTIGNVVTYINSQLAAAGVATRFATQRTAGTPQTIQSGGKTITLGTSSDQWALAVKADSSETVSFSAPAAAGAVYVAQRVGNPDPDKDPTTKDGVTSSQLLKFQTDDATVPDPLQPASSANWVDGRVFSKALDPNVTAVRDTKVGSDGSVYVLADVNGTVNGQTIKGATDVALMKYDSAGNLAYTRTLGASDNATGLALGISSTGQVAVAGSVSGTLNGSLDGVMNSGTTGAYANNSDSFVTVYDADGNEQWTERRGARQADEASQVSFAADGSVYVAGRAQSAIPGSTTLGGYDSYIEGFKAQTNGKVQTLFTQSFGTASSDKPAGMVVDGTNLVTASVENGHAVLRRFDISGAAPVQTASRDLGDLQGGGIVGLALDGGQIVVAGSTSNASLSAGTITRANAGGVDAFAASLSADLTPNAGDSLAYYGGTGDDQATSLAVSNGQVYLGGSAGTDLPGQPAVGTKDGFLTQLDVGAGAVTWSRRFSGTGGYATPSAIAVDPAGSSVLDRLGLPTGTLDLSDSKQLTAISSLRAGDQFTIQGGNSAAGKVTIDANDTLDTLAQKIRRASGFQANVTTTLLNGVRQLSIAPVNSHTILTIAAGKTDQDALATLGIPAGVLRTTTTNSAGKIVPADGKGNYYGLNMDPTINLSTATDVAHARAELQTAMGVIRTAYKDLVAAATPKSAQTAAAAASSGKVPAYLTAQIANYQAGLDRLMGSSSNSSG